MHRLLKSYHYLGFLAFKYYTIQNTIILVTLWPRSKVLTNEIKKTGEPNRKFHNDIQLSRIPYRTNIIVLKKVQIRRAIIFQDPDSESTCTGVNLQSYSVATPVQLKIYMARTQVKKELCCFIHFQFYITVLYLLWSCVFGISVKTLAVEILKYINVYQLLSKLLTLITKHFSFKWC